MKKKKISIALLVVLAGSLLVACNSGNSSSSTTPTNFCEANVANFSAVGSLPLSTAPDDPVWGPQLANLPFPTNLAICNSSISWQQQRVFAAANYWISQKVNYCHHHVPTWYAASSQKPESAFNACDIESNIMPGYYAFGDISRWNYTGLSSQTSSAWYTFNPSLGYGLGNYGYGLDCSDYTKLNYAYAESIYFTSTVALQAGQATNQSQYGPNDASFIDDPEPDPIGLYSAGQLVCADGTLAGPRGQANGYSCDSHGGYISVFGNNLNHKSLYQANAITDAMLNNLQPGDLLYIAGCAADPSATSDAACNYNYRQTVTHVVMWTGQQVGQSSYILNSMLAPQTATDVYGTLHQQCETQPFAWWSANNPANLGAWIITDSHYQGPDYRIFTNCFYRNQVWGVRRVIGVN